MKIFITRHGESEYNTQNRIGGDSNLTEKGHEYGKRLYNFCVKNSNLIPKRCLLSTKKRTIQTAKHLENYMESIDQYSELDEIDAGVAENLTYEEFEQNFTFFAKEREKDKLNFKYPGGESYQDLIVRTKPIVDSIIKKDQDYFIICHRAVARALIYNFTNCQKEAVPNIEIPLHKIIFLENNVARIIEP
jgi:broad specificity phosphatase PhoE